MGSRGGAILLLAAVAAIVATAFGVLFASQSGSAFERRSEDSRRSVPGSLPVLALLAAIVALTATGFGIQFASSDHHGEAMRAGVAQDEGMHAEGDESAAHAEEEGDREGASAGAIASSILISLAAGALVPLALLSQGRRLRRDRSGDEARTAGALAVVGTASILVALVSVEAAVIHFAVIAQHFDEWWLAGLFFLAVGLFQLAWALLVLLRPSTLLYVSGAFVNALVVVTWIVSRTTGVPVGPEAGEPEAIAFPDSCATAFEVVLVFASAALLFGRPTRAPGRRRARAVAHWAWGLVVASLTALALVVLT